MKKIFSALFVFALVFSLAACGGSKDTTYIARAASPSHGWSDELKVSYNANGEITQAVFESYDESGNKKSEASADAYPMDPPPSQWIPQLSSNITEAGSASALQPVAGATMASDNAKLMLEAIEQAKANGDDPATVISVTLPEA